MPVRGKIRNGNVVKPPRGDRRVGHEQNGLFSIPTDEGDAACDEGVVTNSFQNPGVIAFTCLPARSASKSNPVQQTVSFFWAGALTPYVQKMRCANSAVATCPLPLDHRLPVCRSQKSGGPESGVGSQQWAAEQIRAHFPRRLCD